MDKSQIDRDIRDLEQLGYVQELLRDMGGFSNFAVAFSVISILTGIPQFYGYGLQHGGPIQMALGWGLVSVFTMMVALAMAELASAYPTAGALYHWSHFLGGRATGWFTACFNTIGMFAILAGIDYGLATFLLGLFHWEPSATNAWILYAALLFSHSLLNHYGIRLVSWLNDFSAWYHLAVVFILIGALLWKGLVQPVSFLGTFQHTDGYSPQYSFLIGLLLSQWTLTGYDASAHVTEETVDPRRRAPWGIFSAVAISIVAGFLMLATVTLSIPDLAAVTATGDLAFLEVFKLRLGESWGGAVMALVAGAMWLCGLATMTSASRMVYAFARDGGLPLSKLWSQVNAKRRTPSNAIWGLAFFALLLGVSVSVYSAVVSIAVIALYLSYGLPVASRLVARLRGKPGETGPWSLGAFSTPVAIVAVAWVIFITVLFLLPPNDAAAKIVGGLLVGLIVLWFSYVRKHFTGPKMGKDSV